jgi:hypothetical protein
MSTPEAQDYSRGTEECIRLADACIAESNRQLFLYAAAHWQTPAKAVAVENHGPATAQIEPVNRPA